MRKIAVVLLLFYPALIYAESDTAIDLDKYLSETRRIMKALDLKVRKNISMDGELKIRVDTLVADSPAYFGGRPYYTNQDSLSDQIFYKYPTISIRPILDSVLREEKRDNDTLFLLYQSLLIHEMCHYLSSVRTKEYRRDYSVDSLVYFIKQPEEFGPYAVAGYYLLESIDKEALNKIISNSSTSKVRKMENIIEKSWELVFLEFLYFE